MHKRGIFRRYFAFSSAVILASMIILGLLFGYQVSLFWQAQKWDSLEATANLIYQLSSDQQIVGADSFYANSAYIQEISKIVGDSESVDIIITTTNGAISDDSPQHTKRTVDANIMKEINANNAKDQSVTNAVDFRQITTLGGVYPQPYFTIAIPMTGATSSSTVMGGNDTIGYVFVSIPTTDLMDYLQAIIKMFILSCIVALVLTFVVVYIFTSKMTRPLHEMSVAARKMSGGDFSTRVSVNQKNEIGELAVAFNQMAQSLASLEFMRRSFVANVSHELKTPMTSIGGFVDGILDGTIDESRQQHYLEIVSEEVHRLSRLVTAMLGIAQLEAEDAKINITPFNLSNTICTAMLAFERRIQDKNIRVEGLDNLSPAPIDADSGLIHQVAYNLIDNAIKFTPPEGVIRIEVLDEEKQYTVHIRNSGNGISPEQLQHVFERFYKADRSRGMDKNGTGLGLYIVQTIVKLHGGSVDVQSVMGEYTDFMFTLPKTQGNEPKKIR